MQRLTRKNRGLYANSINPNARHVGHKAFYNEKANEIIRFCEACGIQYHIKDKTIT